MDRHEVLQRLLNMFKAPRYLEIGVDIGATFHALRAHSKVGVDVRFAFDVAAARANPANANCRYEEMPSDDFFTIGGGREATFDVIFIDGLHTFDQTLRDLLHSTYRLAEGGIVVVDDVMPNNYMASLPDLAMSRRLWAETGYPDGSWMGDVFRLVFFVEDYMTSFSYATVAENHGQTILWKSPRAHKATPRNVEAISRIDYGEAVFHKGSFNMQPFGAIESAIAAWKRG